MSTGRREMRMRSKGGMGWDGVGGMGGCLYVTTYEFLL